MANVTFQKGNMPPPLWWLLNLIEFWDFISMDTILVKIFFMDKLESFHKSEYSFQHFSLNKRTSQIHTS